MSIELYNTATRRKAPFQPIESGKASLYVCGPTVYDRAHLGNARPVLVFDMLYRLLRHEFGAENVTYVRNFTDVDDKINARAAMTGRAIGEITEETIGWFHADMGALGTLRPTHEPRATGYISEMVAMISDLISDGFAYETEGHVLFRVRKYDAYGQLSGRSVDDMIAGARVEVAPYKEDPMDFVLWKPSDDTQPGWASPWGRGRPGWHIECSAMARALLGARFDIHGGGNDLTFPHHENEIAQSRCAGDDFAQVWMHNEMLQVEGKKMSKSLGNFFTVRELLDQGVPGEVIRFVMLSTHYRKPMDWTEKKRQDAEKTLGKLERAGRLAVDAGFEGDIQGSNQSDAIISSLRNDLDTHGAIRGLLTQAEHVLERASDPNRRDMFLDACEKLMNGLALLGLEGVLDWASQREIDRAARKALIEDYLIARDAAKRAKDYARADAIRDMLLNAGVRLKDTGTGVDWELAPDFDPDKLEALG